MNPAGDSSIYTDFQGLSRLQGEARADPSKALGEAARQFEALFTQMMLKSMREAKLSGGMFNDDQMKTYQEMFDRQIALKLSEGHSLGIADLLIKQLGGGAASAPAGKPPGAAPGSTVQGSSTGQEAAAGGPARLGHGRRLAAILGDPQVRAAAVPLKHF